MSDQRKPVRQPDPDIVYSGTSITLPADPKKMDIDAAISALERKKKDEEQKMSVHERIDHHPHDAIVAMNWAMKETYGWASPIPTPSFFGPKPPSMMKVQTGPKDTDFIQVPCGRFRLPNISEPIQLHTDYDGSGCLHVTGEVRKADRQYIVDLCNMAREYLKTNSIFLGKAVRIPCDSDGNGLFGDIKFIETDNVDVNQLILNPDELGQIDASLWTPVRHTDDCMKHGIPLNRGILLEGTFGTGKSMTAHTTSRICVDNGWTFMMLDDVRALKQALLFAQRYEPCVIFAEDIDRAIEERDDMGNDLLNTIDGILTKHSRVITVLTTNFVEKIDKAMLRPGRLDALVSILPPEPETARKLIRLYGAGLIDGDDTLAKVGEEIAGQIPATIREIVERAKLGMISRGAGSVTDDDLYISAVGMKRHLSLLNTEKEKHTPEHEFGVAARKLLNPSAEDAERAQKELQQQARAVGRAAGRIISSNNELEETTKDVGEAVTTRLKRVKDDTEEILSNF